MKDLTDHADLHQKRIALTPSTDFGGSSVDRLRKFYQGHDFVDNRGRNKDFTLSESMYRDPKPIGKAHGGESSGVPIVAAGGEWVIPPEQVRRVGEGDIDRGHRVLDDFVKAVRKELVGTLQKLPGPRRD
jgi:hypothetical protein